MSCEIALVEAKIPHDSVLIDFDDAAQAAEVGRLNPAGALPVLTEGGKTLTQNIAILEYFADRHPQSKLLPAPGTWERAETMKWLSFVASDLHKAFSPLFGLNAMTNDANTRSEVRKWCVASVNEHLAIVDHQLSNNPFIAGQTFSAADAYLFVVAGWGQWVDIPIAPYKNLSAYMGRIAERPAVHQVLKDAGLLE
jgi:glutathione S-transferase